MNPRWREGLRKLGASLGSFTDDERRMLSLVLALALLGLAIKVWHQPRPGARTAEPARTMRAP